jgi:hypothetical protein
MRVLVTAWMLAPYKKVQAGALDNKHQHDSCKHQDRGRGNVPREALQLLKAVGDDVDESEREQYSRRTRSEEVI